jgi:hypothetical protein
MAGQLQELCVRNWFDLDSLINDLRLTLLAGMVATFGGLQMAPVRVLADNNFTVQWV